MIPSVLSVYGITYRLNRWKELVLFWVARRFPDNVRYYIVVDAAAKATIGKYSDTVVPELTVIELLNRMPK